MPAEKISREGKTMSIKEKVDKWAAEEKADKWWLEYFTPCCDEMSKALKGWRSRLSFMLGEMKLKVGEDELGWPREWVLKYCPFCSNKIEVTGMITDLNKAIRETRRITGKIPEIR